MELTCGQYQSIVSGLIPYTVDKAMVANKQVCVKKNYKK